MHDVTTNDPAARAGWHAGLGVETTYPRVEKETLPADDNAACEHRP